MRILHVINQYSLAGAEISLREIVRYLEGPDCHHGVVVFSPSEGKTTSLQEVGAEVFEPEHALQNTRARVRAVWQAVDTFQPDFLHTSLFQADFAGRLVGRVRRLPVLTSLVNTSDPADMLRDTNVASWKLAAVQQVDRFLARWATSGFHAITEAVAADAVARLGVQRRAVRVVQRGRSPDSLGKKSAARRAAARASYGLDPETFVLVNVGRQEPQKGQLYLIKALAEIREKIPACLLIAGRPGRQTEVLRKTVMETGLSDQVRFLGPVATVPDLLCAADLFVFPSLYEGLGGAVLEAMALEAAVIASDIPALREVLAGEECGRLVPPADPAALAIAICAAAVDPEETARRAQRAHARFESHYTSACMSEGMRLLYQDFYRLTQEKRGKVAFS